jgi:addiction module HigA family antidote
MDQNMNSEKLKFPHPGEILRVEFLEEMGITQYKLAVDIGIPHSRVTAIIKGRRAISPDTALRLSRYFGTSAEFWLGLQKEYDLRKAREELGPTIDKEVRPLALAS